MQGNGLDKDDQRMVVATEFGEQDVSIQCTGINNNATSYGRRTRK